MSEKRGKRPRKENNLDLSNKIFGQVKVINKISGNGVCSIWKCECLNCSKIFNVQQSSLTRGLTKSCGCVQAERAKKNVKEYMGQVEGTNASRIISKKIPTNNTSGTRGVSLVKPTGKWTAYIMFKGKFYNLGTYSDIKDAINARKEAEENLYGEFENWYSKEYPEKYKKLKNRG